MARQMLSSALAMVTLLCAPAAQCGEPSPVIIAKLMERQRQTLTSLRAEIESLRSQLKKAGDADTKKEEAAADKEIKKLETSILRRQAALKKRKEQEKNVTSMESDLDKAESQLNDLTTKRAKRHDAYEKLPSQLKDAQDQLRSAESFGVPRARLFGYRSLDDFVPLDVGDVGTLNNPRVSVLQVLDAARMLITVSQGNRRATVLLMAPTDGIADKSVLPFGDDRLFVVTGTHRYSTTSGATNTVMVLEEIDVNAVRDAIAKKH